MEFTCDHDKCLIKSLSYQFKCSGICDRLFHPKCVGQNQNFMEKVAMPDSGAHWYCSECRQISLSALAFKVSRLGAEFSSLTKKFVEISTNFSNVQEVFSKVCSFPGAYESSADSITIEKTDFGVNTDLTFSNNLVDQANSSSLSTSVVDRHVNKRVRNKNNKNKNNNRHKSIGVNNNNLSMGAAVVNSLITTEFPAVTPETPAGTPMAPAVVQTTDVVATPSDAFTPLLRVVHPSKLVFVSRLHSDTTADQVVQYIKSRNTTGNFNINKCQKISKEFSSCSSFKITVSHEHFSTLLNPGLWPSGVFVKEFIPRRTGASNNFAQVSLPVSKN